MYSNVLFSLPPEARLFLRTPPDFFSREPLKRVISIMHEPDGPGTEKLAANIVNLVLGSPIKVLRAIKGARFVQGSVNDPDKLSVCSFYVNGEEEVKKSSNVYKANQEAIKRFKNMETRPVNRSYYSNLCPEIDLGSGRSFGFQDIVDNNTPVENQTIRDLHRARMTRMPVGVADMFVSPTVVGWDDRPIGWMQQDRGGPHETQTIRGVDFDGDALSVVGITPAYEEWSRQLSRQVLETSQRSGFLRQMTRAQELIMVDDIDREIARELTLGRQNSRNEASRRISRFGEALHNRAYDGLVTSMGQVTIPTEDRRPHLPQNQRNRGPVPRNQRW